MSDWFALAPASELGWSSLLIYIAVNIAEALRADERFVNGMTARAQYYHGCRMFRLERSPAVPYAMIGRILQVDRGTGKRHFRKDADHGDAEFLIGRPSVLSVSEHEELVHAIIARYEDRRPMSIGEVHFFLEDRFKKFIDRNTLWHLLRRDARIKTCRGIPIEEPRLNVTPEAIMAFLQHAMEVVQGVPARFVFNMDEMGHQDWTDRPETTCVVPSLHGDRQVYIPISRAGKRITLMACIALDDSAFKPEVIIPRKTVDIDLVLTGLTSEKNNHPITAHMALWRLGCSIPGSRQPSHRSSINAVPSTNTKDPPFFSLTIARPISVIIFTSYAQRTARSLVIFHTTVQTNCNLSISPCSV
jgi:hypothetical protein